MLFADRRDAGKQLAERVAERSAKLGPDPVVLALPRGGVPVGYEVARRLRAPLEPFIVRKLGVPGQPELAMGAIASGGIVVLSSDLISALGIPEEAIARRIDQEQRELARREQLYRRRPLIALAARGAILVDDGLATGATMLAAIAALRKLEPARISVAVPVASPEACRDIGADVDIIVCGETPEPFRGVGGWYHDFSQTSDDEVCALLAAAATGRADAAARDAAGGPP
jgi:putative phosphoribosyl transferase